MGITEDFREFMAGVVTLEDLQKLSCQALVDFQQNLEVFRREPLHPESELITHLLDVAPSARLTRYLKAGSMHEDPARLVAVKYSALRGLRTHIKQAQTLLVELQIFVKNNSEEMLSTLCRDLENVEVWPFGTEHEENLESHQQTADPRWVQRRQPQESDFVHVMSLILAMLVEDFNMQEKTVNALGLDTKLEVLQSYSLMWTLRPYVDDSVIEQALSWIK